MRCVLSVELSSTLVCVIASLRAAARRFVVSTHDGSDWFTIAAQPDRCGEQSRRSSSRPFRLAMKSVFHWSIGVAKRCEIDPMPCGNCFHLLDPLRSDGPSSLREGFEPALQSKSHAFE